MTGASVVYLLLCAKSINDIVSAYIHVRSSSRAARANFYRAGLQIPSGYCILIIAVAVVLAPAALLKSPEDFWQMVNLMKKWLTIRSFLFHQKVIVSMFCSLVAIALIIYGTSLDYELCAPHAVGATPSPLSTLSAFGTLVFAFGKRCSRRRIYKPIHFFVLAGHASEFFLPSKLFEHL